MSAAIKPKGPRLASPESSSSQWAESYLGSTVGSKILVAITGLLLVGFVVFHMIGNLKLLYGRSSINEYAHFLKHGLGPLLWIARGGLLAIFIGHIALALKLKARTASARPVPYLNQRSTQATLQSRTMLTSGLVVGAFILFHLAHFTFGWTHDADLGNGMRANYLELTDPAGHADVYSMMIAGFSTPWIAVIYVVAQLVLFAHLSHGIQSTIQTIGLKGTRFAGLWTSLGYAVAGTVLLGNLLIVGAVWSGWLAPVYPMAK